MWNFSIRKLFREIENYQTYFFLDGKSTSTTKQSDTYICIYQVWGAYTHIQYTQYSLCGHCTTSDVYTCCRGVPAVMCCLYIRLELWRVSQHAVDSLRHPPRLLLQGGGRWPGPSSQGASRQETQQHPPRHRAGERVRPHYTGIVTLIVTVCPGTSRTRWRKPTSTPRLWTTSNCWCSSSRRETRTITWSWMVWSFSELS